MADYGWSPLIASAAVLAILALIGATTGHLCARWRLSPVVVTIGMLFLLRGVAFVLNGSETRRGFGRGFSYLGRSRWVVLDIPTPVLVAAAWAIVLLVLWFRTRWGRHAHASGARRGRRIRCRDQRGALPAQRLRAHGGRSRNRRPHSIVAPRQRTSGDRGEPRTRGADRRIAGRRGLLRGAGFGRQRDHWCPVPHRPGQRTDPVPRGHELDQESSRAPSSWRRPPFRSPSSERPVASVPIHCPKETAGRNRQWPLPGSPVRDGRSTAQRRRHWKCAARRSPSEARLPSTTSPSRSGRARSWG